MIEFQTPQISAESVENNRGTFTIEPLDRGFGYTFGNSLRRVLLSSLAGAAVTSVRIEGVAHEFSTIPGVKEDVTDIVLNLKEVVCRMHTEADEVEAPLVVTPIDSIFSPVKRVAYSVDAARVGQKTDYDKLTLDIETDGSVDPQNALREAAEILIKYLAIFSDADRVDALRESGAGLVGEPAIGADGGRAGAAPGGMDDILIEELELGVRSYNCLKRAGIQTVGDLIQKSESELNAIPNFGRKSIEEVKETLEARGLSLRND